MQGVKGVGLFRSISEKKKRTRLFICHLGFQVQLVHLQYNQFKYLGKTKSRYLLRGCKISMFIKSY